MASHTVSNKLLGKINEKFVNIYTNYCLYTIIENTNKISK